ncbi:MAG: hypothetical protein H6492_01015 [Candidatus Paracaedibacteraceae bacterium]|nr:hypothetical protein [Candidatus Paracaedibacteraceae bacterium]
MKQILAAIVEYKLTKDNLSRLLDRIQHCMTYDHVNLSNETLKNFSDLYKDIAHFATQDVLTKKDQEILNVTLQEMEQLIVDFLSSTSPRISNACVLDKNHLSL